MNKKIEGGDGAPEAGDVSADRAQQGEPSVEEDAYMHACDEMERFQKLRAKRGVEIGTQGSLCDGIAWLFGRIEELELAATKAAAPADAPSDLTAVIEMAAIWIENIKPEELDLWRSTKAGELRRVLRSIKSGAAPVPDTGIPTNEDQA